MFTVEQENAVIASVCAEFSTFLTGKNTAYAGAFAKDVTYGGSKIAAMDTINVRITDKIRRLQSGNTYAGDNDEEDLLGYLILKKVLKTLQAGEIAVVTSIKPTPVPTPSEGSLLRKS